MVYSLQLWHPAWPLHAQMHSSPAPTDMQANVGVGHSRDSYSPHSGILISRTHQSYPSRPAPVMQVSSRPCLVQPPTQPGCEIPFSSPAAVQAGLPLPSPELHFRLHTGARAMVRSLVHELGIRLGTRAHLLRARRISIGEHTVQDAWPMETLVPLLQRSKRGLEVAVKRARNSTEYR